jgi:hypothetical protein
MGSATLNSERQSRLGTEELTQGGAVYTVMQAAIGILAAGAGEAHFPVTDRTVNSGGR